MDGSITDKKRNYMAKWRSEHADDVKAYAAKWRAENRHRVQEYRRKYNEEHIEERRAAMREYYHTHPELHIKRRVPEEEKQRRKEIRHAEALERERASDKAYRIRNKDRIKAWHKEYRQKLKAMVMDGYGGKCACCGEDEPYFLAIDHVGGGGNMARKNKAHPTGLKFLQWLIAENFSYPVS